MAKIGTDFRMNTFSMARNIHRPPPFLFSTACRQRPSRSEGSVLALPPKNHLGPILYALGDLNVEPGSLLLEALALADFTGRVVYLAPTTAPITGGHADHLAEE